MSKSVKQDRPKARLPKGLRDVEAAEIRGLKRMLRTIEEVYESYGFEPLETPFIEYTDALGKFLPDQDRPNEGVFSFQDDDEQWLSLRYDLTAPLARYVAENYDRLPKPHRTYRSGWVFRNEKPGPGRYRQFMQFDADTVGSASPAADAEVCMMAADTLEALGIPRGQYVIKVSSREILDGLMEVNGLGGPENAKRRLIALRAIDKFDRLKDEGVRALLEEGRLDESGDYTPGAGLNSRQSGALVAYLRTPAASLWQPVDYGLPTDDERIEEMFGRPHFHSSRSILDALSTQLAGSERGQRGIEHLTSMLRIFEASRYGSQRIVVSPEVVRGLEYYTGAVFEAEVLFETKNEEGQTVRFGSVGGGGRYDDLVARFRGEAVPATGFSIGVSRLYAALKQIGKAEEGEVLAPVVVLVMDRNRVGDYQRMVTALRNAGVRAEMYLGSSGMKAQMKYADRRGAPCVVIQGEDERQRGEVQVKDLALGAEMAGAIESREAWREARPAQVSVPEAELVSAVKQVLSRRGG